MNAGEVMSRNPIAVPAEAGLAEALQLMFDHHISGLPVVDGKAGLVGILTEAICCAAARSVRQGSAHAGSTC